VDRSLGRSAKTGKEGLEPLDRTLALLAGDSNRVGHFPQEQQQERRQGKAIDNLIAADQEKPELAVWISSGAYVLSRSAIDRVSPGTRLDLPTLIHSLIGAGETVVGYRHQAAWIDINDENALARAEELAANDEIGPVI